MEGIISDFEFEFYVISITIWIQRLVLKPIIIEWPKPNDNGNICGDLRLKHTKHY
jgi:hypothetical protein